MSESTNQIEEVTFEPGEVLFHEGETSYHFFIIQEGEVEIFRMSEDGLKVHLATAAHGVSVGEFAMVDFMPRSATAQAIGKVKAVRVSEKAYEELLNDLPEWAKSVMIAMVGRVRETSEIIRRAKIIDPALKEKVEQMEYDPDASLIWRPEDGDDIDLEEAPDLSAAPRKISITPKK